MQHFTIYINNTSETSNFIENLLEKRAPNVFEDFNTLDGDILSKNKIDEFINEEERHDIKTVTKDYKQSLKSMSSGEQKKIVLKYLLTTKLDYIILDNPFDNLDKQSKQVLKQTLQELATEIIFILIISRKNDALSFIKNQYSLNDNGELSKIKKLENNTITKDYFKFKIPKPLHEITYTDDVLIHLKNINVSYDNKPIICNINWIIKKGEFWQLKGENGSGKTTLLSMITGENSKGYGQDLYLFGKKKGSGESIWDIKKKIGYYSPTLTNNFYGEHTVLHMLISGLNDSIGLYKYPTEVQINYAEEWLNVLNISHLKHKVFIELPIGQQRLIMVARAMIKHPLLLILDEPTENLDDESASLFVALTNKIATESNTATLFVSHRDEPGLLPKNIFELKKSDKGSTGTIA